MVIQNKMCHYSLQNKLVSYSTNNSLSTGVGNCLTDIEVATDELLGEDGGM